MHDRHLVHFYCKDHGHKLLPRFHLAIYLFTLFLHGTSSLEEDATIYMNNCVLVQSIM